MPTLAPSVNPQPLSKYLHANSCPVSKSMATIEICSCRLWLPRPYHHSTIRKSLAIRPNIPIYLSLLLISIAWMTNPARRRCVHPLFPCPRSLADLIACSILTHVVCTDRMEAVLLLGQCRKSRDREWTLSFMPLKLVTR